MVRRGRSPGRAGLGGPGRQRSPRGLRFGPCQSPSSISCQAKSPGTPHPCQSVHESSSSICPAPRDGCGGLRIPPVSQQQAQMSPSVAGTGSGAGWPWLRVQAAGGRAGTKALGLCTAECGSLLLAPLAPLAPCPGHGHSQPSPRPAHNPRSCCSWFSFWKKLLPNS